MSVMVDRPTQQLRTVRVHPQRSPLRRERPRLYAVDGIRLVAALMVAVHHYAGSRRVDQPGNVVWGRPVSEVMPTVFRFAAYGWIGVWNRLKLRDVLLNFTMLQSGSGVDSVDGVYWTLWSELRFYLLFLAVVATGLTYRKVVVFCCAWGAAAMLAPAADLPLLTLVANPDGAWFFIAGLALYLMHRFGQDLLLWGVLAMAWLMGQRQLGVRIDDFEHVSGWRGSVVIFTAFLLTMVAIALGATDRLRWKWLATAGSLTYPLYLLHYVAGTTVISRLQGTMDARLLVALVIAGFLLLSWAVHRFVEAPVARVLKRGLDTSFARLRNAA
jgi:peptidoglycan/LPS O-acetylase OafA/YrhL